MPWLLNTMTTITFCYGVWQFLNLRTKMKQTRADDAEKMAWVFITRIHSAWASITIAAVLFAAQQIIEAIQHLRQTQ